MTYLDMAVDWAGQTLTDSWGAVLVTDENGIEATAQRASVYLLSE